MKTSKRKNKTSLHLYVPDFLYEELRNISSKQQTTITKYVLKSIVARMNLENNTSIEVDNKKCLHL